MLSLCTQVHMPSQYASSEPQHTLSSGDGGLVYTSSAEQPLAPTKSMLDEHAAAQAVGGAVPTGGAAAGAAAGGAAGSQAAAHS